MPSSMTHAYYAINVYEKLNDKSKNRIKNSLDNLKYYAQGPDSYFFYNLIMTKKGKQIRDFGSYMHRHNVQDFFVNTIDYIYQNNLKNNHEVMAYLYGFICHLILDSTIHPLVFYKTGIFNKKNKKTYKYNGLHYEMEYFIDIYMIYQNEKIEAKYFKLFKYFHKINTLDNDLSKLINITLKETFNLDNMSKYYLESMKDLRLFFKYYNYDRFGIKKLIYQIFDFIAPQNIRRKKPLSFNIKHNQKIHYLNLEKNTWNHPCNIDETYDYSFIELYRISIDKAVNIINQINDILDNYNIDKIKKIIPNTSYITGKDCNNKEKMHYFEF